MTTISGAEFSPDRVHRYSLWRTWDKSKGIAMFIGLNSSTADEVKNDPTVTRCIKYAKRWGYGGMIMSNIFAYRATDPKVMKGAEDPVGPDNDQWLLRSAEEASLIVAVWGNHGQFMERGKAIRNLLEEIELHCLILNKTGHPKHPPYSSSSLKPVLI